MFIQTLFFFEIFDFFLKPFCTKVQPINCEALFLKKFINWSYFCLFCLLNFWIHFYLHAECTIPKKQSGGGGNSQRGPPPKEMCCGKIPEVSLLDRKSNQCCGAFSLRVNQFINILKYLICYLFYIKNNFCITLKSYNDSKKHCCRKNNLINLGELCWLIKCDICGVKHWACSLYLWR